MHDPARDADHYRIDENPRTKEVRIVFLHRTTRKVLAYTILSAEDCYTFGSDLLRKYDTLMGLDDHG